MTMEEQGGEAEPGARPTGALIAVALIPLLATLAFTGIMLFRTTKAPAAPPRADGSSTPPAVEGPVASRGAAATSTPTPGASPAPTTGTPSTSPGAGGSSGGGGSGGGSSGGGSSGGGGGSSGGGGGGGSGGGGTGGGGSGGNPPPTTQPPPPPPPLAAPAVSCSTNGRPRFTCTMTHQASGAVQIRWTRNNQSMAGWDGLSQVLGSCSYSEYVEVAATISDATRSATGSDWFYCPDPPEPPCGPNPCPVASDGRPPASTPSGRPRG